jgi:sugar phosphate isomerase/epimerase
MRLGVSDAFLPERMEELTVEHARRTRDLGFSGVFTRFTSHDPFAVRESECRRVRDLLASEGVTMFQSTGYRPCLVHPVESARGMAVRTLRQALRIAGWLGAVAIDTGPGSVSPNGPWAPDRYNFSPRAQEQLVRSLRESASAAQEHGVLLCLEGHQLVTLRSAEVMAEVVDAVDSPWVRVDFDPANWISLENIYETGTAIRAMADLLKGRIASAHAKDIVLRADMMVHIDYCTLGTGELDVGALMEVMEMEDPMPRLSSRQCQAKRLQTWPPTCTA